MLLNNTILSKLKEKTENNKNQHRFISHLFQMEHDSPHHKFTKDMNKEYNKQLEICCPEEAE